MFLNTYKKIISRGEEGMKKGRMIRYAANTALLAVLVAAGIGVYQLGTSGTNEKEQEKYPSYYDEGIDAEMESDNTVDTGTSLVEADTGESEILAGTDQNKPEENAGLETENVSAEQNAGESIAQTNSAVDQKINENESVDVSANVQEAPKLSFSEDSLMEWPVDGNILLDYDMNQTVYYPTLDQYKLSPAIAVQAVEGAPVLASVPGSVYSIENNARTGTTVTMEIGSGYQAIYGQLTDLTVQEGDTVKEGEIIGYVGAPTKYYSKEGSNLYFAMKKDGEPIDPIAYLP